MFCILLPLSHNVPWTFPISLCVDLAYFWLNNASQDVCISQSKCSLLKILDLFSDFWLWLQFCHKYLTIPLFTYIRVYLQSEFWNSVTDTKGIHILYFDRDCASKGIIPIFIPTDQFSRTSPSPAILVTKLLLRWKWYPSFSVWIF